VDFKELLKVARRRWVTIVAFTVVAILGAGLVSVLATPQYESRARVFVSSPGDTGNTEDRYVSTLFVQARVKSYSNMATSRDLMQRVILRMGLKMGPTELASRVTSSVEDGTVLIDIVVDDPGSDQAQRIAQTVTEELADFIDRLETPRGESRSLVKATVVDSASAPGNPVFPKTRVNMAIAALLGLVVGLGVALLREILDTTVKTREDVEKVVDAPVMVIFGYDPDVPKRPLLTTLDSHAPRVEAFRMLRTNLQYLDLDNEPHSLLITSAMAGEGKTSTSVNLAIAVAQTGKRVVLVDGDLRRPGVASMLNLEGSVGLTTALVGRSTLEESIQVHSASSIHVLTSGPIPPNPTEILQARATRDLLARLESLYDLVIIDAPPLLPVADAAVLARETSGVIMVVRHGKTGRDHLQQAAARLTAVGGRLFGVVLNMAPRRMMKDKDYALEYGYGYGDSPPKSAQKV
jgi:capsular exopolysaccharide synthesis family protein